MDDDGASGYIVYNSYDAGGRNAIDKLTPDFTASSIGQNSGWLPTPAAGGGDAMLQKRTDTSGEAQVRPAPSPSPRFVPGLPHVMRIELIQALISYQDYHMLS